LLSSSYVIRITKPRRKSWAEQVTHTRENRDAYRILVEKSEKIRPLGRPWHRWEYRVKIDINCKFGSVD
jgi:hypothetical protein